MRTCLDAVMVKSSLRLGHDLLPAAFRNGSFVFGQYFQEITYALVVWSIGESIGIRLPVRFGNNLVYGFGRSVVQGGGEAHRGGSIAALQCVATSI